MDPTRLDPDVREHDLQILADADAVACLFARLGWDTAGRLPLTPASLGLAAESVASPIRRIEQIADQDGLFRVLLFDLASVTVAHTRALVRALRDLAGHHLLVLTSDYERIDFVLVEKIAPTLSGSGLRAPVAGVRPRVLTVDRRAPTRVDVRAVRRLAWTCSDAFSQYDKMLAAYAVADWSEPFFDNRALFSDYCLSERLPAMDAWGEDPRPAWTSFRDLYASAAERFANRPERDVREGLFVPAFRALGFDARAGKAPGSTSSGADYTLFDPTDASRPAALCLTYPWARSLDGRDDAHDNETADENPGAEVVGLLESGVAGWAVVSNGRSWRLYCGSAHSRATNYYEVDLEEALAPSPTADPSRAFRYFWLMFRAAAFAPRESLRDGLPVRESFLDGLRSDSSEYARVLGERLKGHVFDRVFPHLAAGFLADRARTGAPPPTDADLTAVFQATLTLLYRLLFLLYAEARGLLPVREVRGYFEASLARMKREVADVAGPIEDDVPARIAAAYRDDSTALYDRLLRLFRVIDRGDAGLNVPLYSGGLFDSSPAADDASPGTEVARFLARYRVDDRNLARAIDLLARAPDPKRHDLGPIDYKSLGVRQLGSIYEGLLEFRVRVAEGTDATGGGPEPTFPAGSVYLENDRRERKATGSYYTPDWIVKYVVREAVGPELDARFDALRPRLRQAEAERRAFFARREAFVAKGLPPPPEEQADLIGRDLVDALFDVKVIDPSMGSGHFLVEVVDFVSDRMIAFLNGFKWTPVTAHLDRIRRAIEGGMEAQGISIDSARLTPVNLLKRHVLKRCIYGVDLNPMAVELAKVSLWLDCFTLGAPLSFLDHHLRCGNSLIGSAVAEVRAALEGPEGPARQLGLFESRFDRLLSATDLMRRVGDLTDVTSEQVRESRDQYRQAADALAPYKRILDAWTARWFGAGEWKQFAGLKEWAKVRDIPAVALLKDIEARALFKAEDDAQVRKALDGLPARLRPIADRVLDAAGQFRFFHWELEFPEVFHRPRPDALAAGVERAADAGFDAVVGNPPWIRQESFAAFKDALSALHGDVFDAVADTYVFFVGRSIGILSPGRRLGLVLPNKWMRADYGKALRTRLTGGARPLALVDFGHAPIFADADTFPCLLLAERTRNEDAADDAFRFCGVPREALPGIESAGLGRFVGGTAYPVSRDQLRPEGWTMLPPEVARLIGKIRTAGRKLKEVVGASPFYGVKTGLNEAFLIDQATRDRLVAEDPGCAVILKKFLRGRDIERWRPRWGGEWMIFARRGIEIDQYPSVRKHLEAYRDQLEPRPDDWSGAWKGRKPGSYQWFELQDTVDYFQLMEGPKIVYQEIQFHSWFALDLDGYYLNNLVHFLPMPSNDVLVAMNSALMWWYLWHTAPHKKDEAYALHKFYMEDLPVVPADGSLTTRLATLTAERQSREDAFFAFLKSDLGLEKPTQRLEKPGDLDATDLQHELKRGGARTDALAVAEATRRLRELHAALDPIAAEARDLEARVHQAAFDAYGLTPDEVALVRRTAPPRDPLTLLEQSAAGRRPATTTRKAAKGPALL